MVFECINFMGQVDRNYMYTPESSAVCNYHYCVILKDRVSSRHNTISCSGAVMRFGDDNYFFNPITPFVMDFSSMLPMPSSAVDLLSTGIDFYYTKDVQTTFAQDIMLVNCTNDFKTCLTFANTSTCFGNMDDMTVIHSEKAITFGAMSSLAVGAFVIFILMPKLHDKPPWYVFLMYVMPIVAIALIYSGVALSPRIPFVLGAFMVMWSFPFIFYGFRDVYRNTDGYKAVERMEEDDKKRPQDSF